MFMTSVKKIRFLTSFYSVQVASWESDKDFEDALKKAGLM